MSNLVMLTSALRLPESNYEALLSGKVVSIVPKTFLRPGQFFAICSESEKDFFTLKAWARCEACQAPKWMYAPEDLSTITGLSLEEIKETLSKREVFFLSHLRVYLLENPVQEFLTFNGQFSALSESLAVSSIPLLNDQCFKQRIRCLEDGKLQIAEISSWEQFQIELSSLATREPKAKQFCEDINCLYNQDRSYVLMQKRTIPDWVQKISLLATRSIEEEEGQKSNYQAGTDFENIVHKSLNALGFTIDPAHHGGAGGLDLFCSSPYNLVGECKSGRKIKNETAVQLLNLGTLRLKDEQILRNAVKIIIGPGQPTEQLQEAAEVHGMSIINPKTLEKLVELHHYHPIDLFKLRDYFEKGKSDESLECFIQEHLKNIKLRSYITQLVKEFLKKTCDSSADVSQLHTIYSYQSPPEILSREEFHEILIELSSPLAGYLGRKRDADGSDRFYFLRDLPVDDITS